MVMAIRAFTSTTTASPSALSFLIAGVLAVFPLAFLWEAQSLFLEGVTSGNISLTAPSLISYLRLTIISAVVLTLIFLVASFVPLPSLLRAKRKWAPLFVLLIFSAR